MLDKVQNVEVRFGKVYQDIAPPKKIASMPQAVAWAVVVAFALTVVATSAAPFVDSRYRVAVGLTAAVALITFFTLAGAVRSMRGDR